MLVYQRVSVMIQALPPAACCHGFQGRGRLSSGGHGFTRHLRNEEPSGRGTVIVTLETMETGTCKRGKLGNVPKMELEMGIAKGKQFF